MPPATPNRGNPATQQPKLSEQLLRLDDDGTLENFGDLVGENDHGGCRDVSATVESHDQVAAARADQVCGPVAPVVVAAVAGDQRFSVDFDPRRRVGTG